MFIIFSRCEDRSTIIVYPSVWMSICLCVGPSVCVCMFLLGFCFYHCFLSVRLSARLSVRLSARLPVSLFVCLFMCICFCVVFVFVIVFNASNTHSGETSWQHISHISLNISLRLSTTRRTATPFRRQASSNLKCVVCWPSAEYVVCYKNINKNRRVFFKLRCRYWCCVCRSTRTSEWSEIEDEWKLGSLKT